MVKATIEYKDGTTLTVKKKSFTELTNYYESEKEHGAVGFHGKSEKGEFASREYRGGTSRADGT